MVIPPLIRIGISALSGSHLAELAVGHHQFWQGWRRELVWASLLGKAALCIPGNNTLCLLRICWTQVRYLRRLELGESRLSTKCSTITSPWSRPSIECRKRWRTRELRLQNLSCWTWQTSWHIQGFCCKHYVGFSTRTQVEFILAVRCIRCIFVAILQQIFHLWNEQTTGIVELLEEIQQPFMLRYKQRTWTKFQGRSVLLLGLWSVSQPCRHERLRVVCIQRLWGVWIT